MIAEELKPVVEILQSEGLEVGTFSSRHGEDTCLFWFENGRILSIQPTPYRSRHNKDCYTLSVCYVPTRQNGSGCRIAGEDWGNEALSLLSFRKNPTWVRGIKNYTSLDEYITREGGVLHYYKIEPYYKLETPE